MKLAEQYEIKVMHLTIGRGGRPGRKITPKALVLHWTSNTNPGADAVANRNYFENNPENKVSAHYIVDDHQVVQCIPEGEMAFHVGAKKYNQVSLEKLSAYPNDCTIGIEMCVNKGGDFLKTYKNTVILVAKILHGYKWGIDRLWRHYDITWKDCPRFFVHDPTARAFGFTDANAGWGKIKKDVAKEIKSLEAVSMFKDIIGHWAQGNIEHLAKLGIVHGKTIDTFEPNSQVTRAELAAVVDRAIIYVLGEVKRQQNMGGGV